MRYIIGTGWWCSDANGTSGIELGHPKIGDAIIRSTAFFNVWSYFVNRYTKPVKKIVVDSNSPIKPPGWKTDPDFEWVSLDRNYHSVKGTGFNGWIRGFMFGAQYAWMCQADFLYIEQDCLVVGKHWVDAIYKASGRRNMLFGKRFRSPIQQSLVFIPHDAIQVFIYHLTSIKERMTCENRFKKTSMMPGGIAYKGLPFGCGRDRPIDWTAKHFYAQHWTRPELRRLGKREHVNNLISTLLDGGSHEGGSVHSDSSKQHETAGKESTSTG